MQASCSLSRPALAKQRPSQAWRQGPSRRPAAAGRAALRVVSYVGEAKAEAKAAPPAPQAPNQLEALKQMSKVVADTGEVEAIRTYRPVDCTTNPSLVLKAMQIPDYASYLDQAIAEENGRTADGARPYGLVADRLAVTIGAELLKLVPGRVSTEVDAHLSYDTQATVDKALHILDLYSQRDVDTSRIFIKIASTWEGIRACEQLQKQSIDCNMTLLFSFAQAAACAEAGAALISPFVGRILDWHKKAHSRDYAPHEDPGVLSVKRVYQYFKRYSYNTTVMAASFRNVSEIRELAGCDAITISPALLKELEASTDPLPYALWPEMGGCEDQHYKLDASAHSLFNKMHNEDQMAVDKLREGIDGFAADQRKLEDLIAIAMKK